MNPLTQAGRAGKKKGGCPPLNDEMGSRLAGACRAGGSPVLVAQILFDGHYHLEWLARAQHRDGQLGAGAALYNLVHGGTYPGDRFTVDLEQHVTSLQATFGCRTDRIQTLDDEATQFAQVHHAGDDGVDLDAGDAEITANDAAVGDQLVHDPLGQPVGDGKADAVALLIAVEVIGGCVDANQIAPTVDQSPPRVASIDGRVGLQQILSAIAVGPHAGEAGTAGRTG